MKQRIVIGALAGAALYGVGRYLRLRKLDDGKYQWQLLQLIRPEDPNFWAAVVIGGAGAWAIQKIH